MKKFLNRKIGNQISGIMPMWLYLLVITCVTVPIILKLIL